MKVFPNYQMDNIYLRNDPLLPATMLNIVSIPDSRFFPTTVLAWGLMPWSSLNYEPHFLQMVHWSYARLYLWPRNYPIYYLHQKQTNRLFYKKLSCSKCHQTNKKLVQNTLYSFFSSYLMIFFE